MIALLLPLLSGLAVSAPASRPVDTTHRLIAIADIGDVAESSGVIASRLNRDVFWTHNDSGDGPFVYPFRLSAADRAKGVAHILGRIELTGARNVDWEDIAWGAGHTIYLFDGGDNSPCHRSDKRVYRFIEPRLDANGPALRLRLPCENMQFEYPDPQHPNQPVHCNEQRFDAECFFVHPTTQDIYVVTKRDFRKVPIARVYKFPGAKIRWNVPTALHVLEFVADITPKVRGLLDAMTLINSITGGDIDASGTRLVLRDYLKAMEFVLPAGQPFDRIFEQTPITTLLVGEPQGEGVCYTIDGQEMITTSEVKDFKRDRFPVYATPSATAGRPQSIESKPRQRAGRTTITTGCLEYRGNE